MSKIVLKIDNRERELKTHFELKKEELNIKVDNLDIGDILFEKDGVPILIIERKIITDLAASIIDGRHKEQKTRLLGSGINKSRIMYLIEGDINKTNVTIKGGCDTLLSSIINTMFRDGLNVYKTASIKESIQLIEKLLEKFNKDLDMFWNFDSKANELTSSCVEVEYAATLKQKKKDNVTSKVWFASLLMLIPQLTPKIADCIIKTYPTLSCLMNTYNSLEDETQKKKLLQELTFVNASGKSRKVGPALSVRVYELIHLQ